MCYKIREKSDRKISRISVYQSKHYTFKIYEFAFNQQFAHLELVNPIIWYNSDLPYVSKQFAKPVVFLKTNSSGTPLTNMLYVSPVDTEVTLLEAPYDTKCIKSSLNPHANFRKCLIDEYVRIQLVPGYDMIEFPYKFVPVSNREYSNRTTLKILNDIYTDCHKRYMFINCHETFTQTFVDVVKAFNKTFAVAAMLSSQTETSTKAQPAMSFVDYFSFMCGCFGTWFGLSFLSFDPSQVWLKRRDSRTMSRRRSRFTVRFPSHTWICTSQRNRQ
jgi:hypothetical protein